MAAKPTYPYHVLLPYELVQLEHLAPPQVVVAHRDLDVFIAQLQRARPRVQLDRDLVDALRQEDRHRVLERLGRVGQRADGLGAVLRVPVVVHVDDPDGVVLQSDWGKNGKIEYTLSSEFGVLGGGDGGARIHYSMTVCVFRRFFPSRHLFLSNYQLIQM